MVKIKLAPFGKKNDISYRIVVAECKSKITGKSLATLGQYHPLSGESVLDKKAVDEWVKKGAQLTDRVKKIYSQLK